MWSSDDRKKVLGLFVLFLVVSIALAIDLRPKGSFGRAPPHLRTNFTFPKSFAC